MAAAVLSEVAGSVRRVNTSLEAQAGSLKDKVALVTGATRGCGRAIAIELGRLGATVYATGRTTRASGSAQSWPSTTVRG